MKSKTFKLQVRVVEISELSRISPHLPDQDEYETYLDALENDLAILGEISRSGSSEFRIESPSPVTEVEVLNLIKPLLTGSLADRLRFVSLTSE